METGKIRDNVRNLANKKFGKKFGENMEIRFIFLLFRLKISIIKNESTCIIYYILKSVRLKIINISHNYRKK